MSLEDGDIIMSGTPKGVATYKKGQEFSVKLFCALKLVAAYNSKVRAIACRDFFIIKMLIANIE